MKTFDLAAEWEKSFADEYSRTLKYTDVPVEDWKVAGKATRDKPNKEDLAWWKNEGLKHVTDYIDWYQKKGWEIAILPDGKPAIEWEGVVEFAGVEIKVIIDAVYRSGDELIIVDYKTGKMDPMGNVQLGLYASAIEKVFGVRPRWGGYYMTRKANLTQLVDLSPWTIEFFEYQVTAMKSYAATDYWPMNVGQSCYICSFTEYCQGFGGSKAHEIPLKIKTTIEGVAGE